MENEARYGYTDPTDLEDPPPTDWAKTGGVAGGATSQPAAPASPWNREQFRDAWMATGSDRARQDELLRQNNLTLDGAGRAKLPSGETLDLRIGARAGGSQAGWTSVAGGGQKTGQAAGYSDPNMGGAAGGGNSSGGSGYQDAVRAALLAQLGQMGKPIDPNDPVIKTQMDAQANLLERQRQQRRSAMAERMAASGLNSGGAGSGAMDQEIAAGFEDKASQLGGLQGQLMARANEQRISQLQQALALAVQSGDAESARSLQMEIARMGNALGQAQLGQAQSQWNDNYGLRSSELQYLRDRDAARARLGLDF